MRTGDFDNHDIIKLLMPVITDYMKRQTPEKIISQPTIKEKKAIEILFGINRITECIDQIYFSIEMLSGFRKKKNSIINRHDHVVFMIENFYLRTTSVFDRMLRFSNVIFDIGLPEKECRESTIIRNQKIKGTPVELALKKVDKLINDYKPIRNQVAHANTFQDDELPTIQEFYYLIDKGTPELKKYKHFYKLRANRYVNNKKEELIKSANQIKKATLEFFDSMVPYVKLNLKESE